VICSRRLHILRKLRSLLSTSSLLLVYHAIIRSVLEYACPVFVGLNKKNSDIIQRIEKRAFKIITHKSTESIATHITDTSLEQRRFYLSKKLWENIENDPDHVLKSLMPKRLHFSNQYALEFYRTQKLGESFFLLMARFLNSASL